MNTFVIKSDNGGLLVGRDTSVKINCNIGANDEYLYKKEIDKLNAICDSDLWPDMFMDLSLYRGNIPLYKDFIRRVGCPVGVVPSYLFNKSVIDQEVANDILKRLADDGISFLTLHLTADLVLLEIAKRRKIPITSRGVQYCFLI